MTALNKYNTPSTKTNLNKEIIALFSGQQSVITVPRLYVKLCKGLRAGNVLNQCVFYSDKSELQDGWFWKSYKEWQEDILVSERTLRRIFTRFEQEGWICKRTMKIKGVRTLLIKPNMDKIIAGIESLLDVQKLPQTAIMPVENPCINPALTGQNDRTAKRPKCPNLSIIHMRSSDEITTETKPPEIIPPQEPEADPVVIVFGKETDKRIIKRIEEEVPNRDKGMLQLLKEIYHHYKTNHPNELWKGINTALKMMRDGVWGTPTGFVDTAAVQANKSAIEARNEAQIRANFELSEKKRLAMIADFYKTQGGCLA